MSDHNFPDLEDVWMEPYNILDRTWLLLNDLTVNPDTRNYFYCALELRFFIEAVFFTLVAKFKNGALAKKDFKVYRPKDYHKVLSNIDNKYYLIACKELGWILNKGEINKLSQTYGVLGSVLHLPKTPFLEEEHDDWKLDIEGTVLDSFKYLKTIIGYKEPGEN